MQKNAIQKILIVCFVILLFIPAVTIANNKGVVEKNTTYLLLRYAGLYAITLLFIQVISGAFMQPLIRVFGPRIFKWHIKEGILTYGIVLTHPLLYVIYTMQKEGASNALLLLIPHVTTEQEIALTLGKIGLLLLSVGVGAAIWRAHPFIAKYWRAFHILNYIAFLFVLSHSARIGSDTQTPPFVFLYPLFLGGLFISVIYRRVFRLYKTLPQSPTPQL